MKVKADVGLGSTVNLENYWKMMFMLGLFQQPLLIYFYTYDMRKEKKEHLLDVNWSKPTSDEINPIVLFSSWQTSPSVTAASPPLQDLPPLLVLIQGQETRRGNRPGSA